MATVTIVKRPLKRQKGKFSYVVQYVDPETKQKRYYGTYRKWKEADDERTKLKIQLEGGEIPAPRKEQTKKNGKTVGEACKGCKDEWERRVKEGSLSQNSLNGYLYPCTPCTACGATGPSA